MNMGHVWTCMKLTWHMEDLDMGHGTCMNIYETYMAHGTFGHGAWTRDMYEHVWNLDVGHGHGICMNMYETWTWGMGYVWTCMKLEHGTFQHMAWAGGMYEHVWNLDMEYLNMGHGACLCDFCYRLMVMVGVWCQTCGIMFRWWTSTIFVLKLLKSFGNGGSVKEC
jgi:hypothetical protein